jgi:hypothetical protein
VGAAGTTRLPEVAKPSFFRQAGPREIGDFAVWDRGIAVEPGCAEAGPGEFRIVLQCDFHLRPGFVKATQADESDGDVERSVPVRVERLLKRGGNVLLFCGVGNHVNLCGLPGGAEGIRTSASRACVRGCPAICR